MRPNVYLGEFVIMPNHFHAILRVAGRGTARRAPALERFGKPVPGSLPTIIRSFKSAASKRVNELRGSPGTAVWQRNYYEHIIREPEEWSRIRAYIAGNPARWAEDEENPGETSTKRKKGTDYINKLPC